jgi:hypothetical protein
VYEERYQPRYGFLRPVIPEVVHKFLDCGDLESGCRLETADYSFRARKCPLKNAHTLRLHFVAALQPHAYCPLAGRPAVRGVHGRVVRRCRVSPAAAVAPWGV